MAVGLIIAQGLMDLASVMPGAKGDTGITGAIGLQGMLLPQTFLQLGRYIDLLFFIMFAIKNNATLLIGN